MRPFSRACFVVACLAALVGPLQAAQVVALGASNTIGRGRGSTPDGVPPQFLGGVGDMCGPMLHFAGLAAAADGTVYISGDAEGSVLALRPA